MRFVSVDGFLPVSRDMMHSRDDCDVFGIHYWGMHEFTCQRVQPGDLTGVHGAAIGGRANVVGILLDRGGRAR